MTDRDRPLDFSITVVSHGHQTLIERYLPSIFDTPTNATVEVLLVDNTGSDEAAAWTERTFPQVRVVRNPRPLSFAANMNLGARLLTRGRYFVVWNPDIKCLPGLFDEAKRFMDAHPDAGLMGPKLLNPDGTIQPSCRAFPTPLITAIRGLGLDRPLARTRLVRRYLLSDDAHDRPMDVDWVTGALMITRREAFAAIGGMDEGYVGAYAEDIDLCIRMWHAGWRVAYVPQASAVHEHQREGVRSPLSHMARLQLRNSVRVYQKYGWRFTRDPRA